MTELRAVSASLLGMVHGELGPTAWRMPVAMLPSANPRHPEPPRC